MRFHVHISGFSYEIIRLDEGRGPSGVVTGPLARATPLQSTRSTRGGCKPLAPAWLRDTLELQAPLWPTLTSDPGFLTAPPTATHTPRTQAPGYPQTACVGGGRHSTKDGPPSRSCCSPGTWTYIVLRPAAFMWGELTLACCLLPPISPIKNILPSRSARSSPGPQLYFINTFRQVQKGMIHAGPEHS